MMALAMSVAVFLLMFLMWRAIGRRWWPFP